MEIDWARKLSSRKLWGMIAGFVTGLLLLFKVDADTVTQIAGVIMSFGSIVIYIIAEAYVDGKNGKHVENGIIYAEPLKPIQDEVME